MWTRRGSRYPALSRPAAHPPSRNPALEMLPSVILPSLRDAAVGNPSFSLVGQRIRQQPHLVSLSSRPPFLLTNRIGYQILSARKQITLDTRDPAEKLAYSCALAQSAKLFVFEERLNNTVESTSKYPQMLAATGKIPLTEVQIG